MMGRTEPATANGPTIGPDPLNVSTAPYAPPRRASNASDSSRPPTPTYKLAETAVGVREVARNLGRARVRCDVPKTVMIVAKIQDARLVALTREITVWLIDHVRTADGTPLTVYVDEQVRTHPKFDYPSLAGYPIEFWTPALCASDPDMIDLVITLGGDGTVLYTSWLFQHVVPPVIPFHLGSLGFLTVFDFAKYKALLRQVFTHGVRVNLRMRFSCTVFRARDQNGGLVAGSLARRRAKSLDMMAKQQGGGAAAAAAAALAASSTEPSVAATAAAVKCATTVAAKGRAAAGAAAALAPPPLPEDDTAGVHDRYPTVESMTGGPAGSGSVTPRTETMFTHHGVRITTETFQVLNELVVDRGPSAYMSQLELFGDERHLTTVQADGLVVSTPTGSTAYSLSAGGSIVHPEVSALLVTPICPHTLSFRPMLLPDSMELKVCVPPSSRNTAWASFDGRHRIELKQGDFVSITASKYPFPTICLHDQSSDWFNSLARCLRWNERQRQKAFTDNAFGFPEDDEDEEDQDDYDDEDSEPYARRHRATSAEDVEDLVDARALRRRDRSTSPSGSRTRMSAPAVLDDDLNEEDGVSRTSSLSRHLAHAASVAARRASAASTPAAATTPTTPLSESTPTLATPAPRRTAPNATATDTGTESDELNVVDEEGNMHAGRAWNVADFMGRGAAMASPRRGGTPNGTTPTSVSMGTVRAASPKL
ncbi:hypothetical protein GGF31_005452 [Allomyces arbusculus]|nr:hypothetical protein GGF31_005452 [Allomyces arbusculus]